MAWHVAQEDPRLAGCIAFEPRLDFETQLDAIPALKELSDIGEYVTQISPLAEYASLKCPLLIVQSDTTNKDVVNRGYNKLIRERENVSVVFNKAQSYGPKWISGED